jgi:hypothetical protein
MTIVQQIITDAYRNSNLIAVGTQPNLAQQNEALRYLNRLISSVFGNEAGEKLEAFPIGRVNIARPQGYPYYNQTPANNWFVPVNKRLMLNLDDPCSVYLTPMPCDGARFAIKDIQGNLSTNPLTVYGNGRTFENQQSLVLNTNGQDSQWFYRQDLGNWQKLASLEIADEFPFPEEFEDMFVFMLAMRLNPAYEQAMDEQSGTLLERARSQFRARYRQTIEVGSEAGLIRLPMTTQDRVFYQPDAWNGDPTSLFYAGYPY